MDNILPNIQAPLLPIKHVTIDAKNIALQRRAAVAQQLSKQELKQTRRRLTEIAKLIQGVDYDELLNRLESSREIDRDLQLLIIDSAQSEISILNGLSETDGQDRSSDIAALYESIDQAEQQLAIADSATQTEAMLKLINEYKDLGVKLSNHDLAVNRDKAQRELQRALAEEVDIYRELIIDRWTRLGYCHRYRQGERDIVESVKIGDVMISPDAIYFKIAASKKTLFGGWKSILPYGVRISDQLLSPTTLSELSLVCQRQVTGVMNNNGAWVVIHRLDTIDGLLNLVRYRSIMEYYPHADHDRMPIPVGVGEARTMQWLNLSDFPHGLIAGWTGAGKSNMANVVLCSLISQQSPTDLRLMLIDLKGGLEFDAYEQLPHVHKMVTTVEAVRDSLAEIEALMYQRFELMRGIAKNVREWNARRPSNRIPRVLVFFDEVASIMDHGETTKAILASLREISRLGRAVGVHMWLATQRPDIKAIEGQIKVNLAVRLSGRMPSSADSVTILGSGDAAKLAAVPGRMILQLGPDPLPVQTPLIDQNDIDEALLKAMSMNAPQPLDIPETAKVIHQQWTPERVIELSLEHLGGRITAKDIYRAVDDMSQAQARDLVKQVWAMSPIVHDGIEYEVVKGKGWEKVLKPVES